MTPLEILFDRIRRLHRLSWADRVLLSRAAATCGGVWIGLHVISFRRIVYWTGTPSDRPITNEDPIIQRILWAARTVAPRLIPSRPCLTEALAARFLLARQGVAADLQIGVAQTPQKALHAHAWLERRGEVLHGTDATTLTQYTTLTNRLSSSTTPQKT